MKKLLLITIPVFLLGSGQVANSVDAVVLPIEKIVVETPKQNTAIGEATVERTNAENEESAEMQKQDSLDFVKRQKIDSINNIRKMKF